jgi:hypothetical protein
LPALANLVAHVKITDSDCELFMDNELILFLSSVGLLILYLVWSAKTEMGTKNPWKK